MKTNELIPLTFEVVDLSEVDFIRGGGSNQGCAVAGGGFCGPDGGGGGTDGGGFVGFPDMAGRKDAFNGCGGWCGMCEGGCGIANGMCGGGAM